MNVQRTFNVETMKEIIRVTNSTKRADEALWKGSIIAIKRPDGSIPRDRDEILKTATHFYSELYSSKVGVARSSDDTCNARQLSVDGITEVEVLNATKKLKNNKSPGIDKISNELLKYAASVHSEIPTLSAVQQMPERQRCTKVLEKCTDHFSLQER